MVLPIVTQYKYLDIVITEFIDYDVVAQILADAANRAVINKYKKLMVLEIILILNHSIMQLILFWIIPVKYGDIRILHKYMQFKTRQLEYFRECINLYILLPSIEIWVGHKTNIIRFLNRLMCMNNNRLPKILFNCDYSG